MDYHARHGHDVCSFDLPSTHRLPTVSAAQALEELNDGAATHVLTGLPDLDRALTGRSQPGAPNEQDEKGGLSKGQITEIWGPPGVGKTAVAIQAAVNVLRDGKSVVWVDCFHPVCHERFAQLCNVASSNKDQTTNPLDKLVHFTCPTLAHFIALLCRPTQSSVPSDTALVVIDSLSALLNHAFPRALASRGATNGNNKGLSPSSRRIQILQYIVGALQKLAATRDAAVVLLSQCATRMQAERGATLIPAITANVWEQGIATRIALYRDWVWSEGSTLGARLAAVQKVNGKVSLEALEKAFAYDIQSTGLIPAAYDGVQPAGASSCTPAQKRKLDETRFETSDSGDEYGWGEEDTSALPGQPPQWQGSEDIILGTRPDTDDDNDNDNDATGLDSGSEKGNEQD